MSGLSARPSPGIVQVAGSPFGPVARVADLDRNAAKLVQDSRFCADGLEVHRAFR
jgi:hypothetical protein